MSDTEIIGLHPCVVTNSKGIAQRKIKTEYEYSSISVVQPPDGSRRIEVRQGDLVCFTFDLTAEQAKYLAGLLA